MLNFCSLKDAFPNINKEKRDSGSNYNDDNLSISKKINKLDRREIIKPEKDIYAPMDKEVNLINKELFEDLDKKYKNIVDKLKDEIIHLKDEFAFSSNKSDDKNLLEGFSMGIESNQLNELILYICTCIFFIFLFDYMYSFGKRSF